MYEHNDTIAAVSSPTSGERAIVRISGPDTIKKINQIFRPLIHVKRGTRDERRETRLVTGSVAIDDGLRMDAKLYLFLAPDSYTGDDVAEIHVHTNASVIEALLGRLLGDSGVPVRMAGPGEFTARSFLNGKMDLSQAEAVNEIIVSSNKFQLAAAEKLLAGRLAESTAEVCSRLMDCLSLIEAGLDFSGEDIEFITCSDAIGKLVEITEQLEQLLSDNISYESVIDLPAVGIAGAPNSGKSSLLNKLLGKSRSIVSSQRKTTRDVLTGLLTLKHCRCVLFDCAGLMQETHNILDELAQQAAIESLRKASVVVFCIDMSSQKSEIRTQKFLLSSVPCFLGPAVIPVSTKSDLLGEQVLAQRLAELNKLFAAEFLPISAETGTGVEQLKGMIDERIVELATGGVGCDTRYGMRDTKYEIALTARHRQAVTEAIENISESVSELKAGNDEVAAMMLRAACQGLSNIEHQHIDEQILERIFKNFCIGK